MEIFRTIVMLLSFALIAALGAGLFLWNRKKSGEETRAELAEIANIREVLKAAAFGLVTQLEIEYGGGTGALKRSQAINWLLQLIPERLRGLFSAQTLTDIIEDVLATAKLLWKKNPALLIKGGFAAIEFDTSPSYDEYTGKTE